MKATCYAHSSRDSMFRIGEDLSLEGEALQLFSHALCEVEIELEVEMNGTAEIVAVNGRKLEEK